MDVTAYHKVTAYSRNNMSPHSLDWENTPTLYKTYPSLPSVTLQPSKMLPDVSLWRIYENSMASAAPAGMNIHDLSTILTLAYGLTAKRRYGAQTHFYRSAPSAGALYPSEIYVAAGSVEGLQSGLYNYHVMSSSLTRLREGLHLQYVTDALTAKVEQPPAASFLISGIFFRSAWKYRARAFRYVLLDAGHLIENLALALNAYGYSFSVHYDFVDETMGHLLGIDEAREVCLACLNIYDSRGGRSRTAEAPLTEVPDLDRGIVHAGRVSAAEVPYTAIHQIYRAGKTVDNDAVEGAAPYRVIDDMPQAWFPIRYAGESAEGQRYAESVLQRRSRRNFVPYPFQAAHAMLILKMLCMAPTPAVDEGQTYAGCMTPGFMAVNIEGFDPGFYLLATRKREYGRVSGESSGEKMAHVCLDQQWLKNGAVHFLFMANLAEVDLHQGARGYRYAMLNAGRAGQRIYLTATALGYGACGIGALYDDEAREMLSLNDQSALLYLVAVGTVKPKIG